MARALASVYLYRNPGIPLVIFADQKTSYLDALELADEGTLQPFVDFISARATDAVLLVSAELTRIGARHRRAELLSKFGNSPQSEIGLSYLDTDTAAERALEALRAEYTVQVGNMALPPGVRFDIVLGGSALLLQNEGYRVPTDSQTLMITATSTSPVPAEIRNPLTTQIAVGEKPPAPFTVFGSGSSSISFNVEDLVPVVSQVAQWRIAAWVEIELTRQLELLYEQIELKLRSSGYR